MFELNPPHNPRSAVKTTHRYYKLPMLIDMHVHVREPGDEQKETWDTCSRAALKGGNGLICAMPNTKPFLLLTKN